MDTISIPFQKQQWSVTPGFHAVVGPITKAQFKQVWEAWKAHFGKDGSPKPMYVLPAGEQVFTYVTDKDRLIAKLREKWAERSLLFFTNDPLIVNQLKPEEVTLACVVGGEVLLVNFKDLPNIDIGLQIFRLGEYWVSYAEGGAEEDLRGLKYERQEYRGKAPPSETDPVSQPGSPL